MFLSITLPPNLIRPYRYLRILLWGAALYIGGWLCLTFLFPDFTYTVSFRNPNSSKNTLLDPRLNDGVSRSNGKLSPAETLLVNGGISGNFSDAEIVLKLEKKSGYTQTINAQIRKVYRAFLFPEGPILDTFPQEDLYRIGENYYVLREGILHTFVSEKAYLSRYPKEFARTETLTWLAQFPLADDFIGFRVGSLLSFADGVFIVTREDEIRPVGSADIFLVLGYRFEDIVPVSEEDLGIYKRGRIIQLGFIHPDGTLFLDQETDTLYLIEGDKKRAVINREYRQFLESQQKPIIASQQALNVTSSCVLTSNILPRRLSCRVPFDILNSLPGSDFELSLSQVEQPIDINTVWVTLETRKNIDNALRFLSQIKTRILNRFGFTYE